MSAIEKTKVRSVFQKLKIAKDSISDAGQVFDIVDSALGNGSLAQVTRLTSWVVDKWSSIWSMLQNGLDCIMSFVEECWDAVKGAISSFWDWLMSLFS